MSRARVESREGSLPADADTTVEPSLSERLLDRMAARPLGRAGWNIWRAVVGLAYLGAAVFNTFYTLPRSDELDGYADGAWFGFLGDFMRDVFMPNGDVFMSLVIVFELAVAVLVLGRGASVDLGVTASVLWVLAVLPFLAWPYLVTNLVLAPVQGVLLLRRYDRTLWSRAVPLAWRRPG